MAGMVFGNPITEETLKGMPEYRNKTTITRTDKARVALLLKNVAEAQAFEHIENLKNAGCGCDDGVSTLVTIYNATGGTIKYSVKRDFAGQLDEESTYPVKIENGECGVFKHVEITGQNGSRGAVVYWGINKDEKACDWMFSWSNPNPINHKNKVFAEIAEHGHYKPKSNDPAWIHVQEELGNSSTTSTYEWKGCESSMTSTRSTNVETLVVVDATASLK